MAFVQHVWIITFIRNLILFEHIPIPSILLAAMFVVSAIALLIGFSSSRRKDKQANTDIDYVHEKNMRSPINAAQFSPIVYGGYKMPPVQYRESINPVLASDATIDKS